MIGFGRNAMKVFVRPHFTFLLVGNLTTFCAGNAFGAETLPELSISAPLDVHTTAGSVIKEARLPDTTHKIGEYDARYYRNIVATLVRVNRPEAPEFTFHVFFEVYANGRCTLGLNRGVKLDVRRDNMTLETVVSGRIPEMQQPRIWYRVERHGKLKGEAFEASDRFNFTANSDDVVPC
jgi:hypothetical protein